MVEELSKLYNTLLLVETKGESTKHMANCLNYLTALISREASKTAADDNESGD